MRPFKITLKNYRCFEDTKPLTVELGPGFSALVGPNNSGKSSFLRFFYEARALFGSLKNANLLQNLVIGNKHTAQFQNVDDQVEVFFNRNDRPLLIELDFPAIDGTEVSKVRLTTERSQLNVWSAEFYCGVPPVRIVGNTANGFPHFVTEKGIFVVNFSSLFEFCDSVAGSVYVGPFRNAISEGAGTYYDLAIGSTFIDTWDQLKTGPNRGQNLIIQKVTDDIEHIFDYQRLEINAAANPRTLQVIADARPFRLRELGGGLAQFIVVLGNVAVRKPTILLIDEPELNLHPSLQADFLTSLAAHSNDGVIFATHSLGLARTIGDRVYSFQKDGYRSVAKVFEQTPAFAEFVGEMSFSSFKEMGFETILLVEGVTEVKAIQQFLRGLKKDHQVVVIPLGGSSLIRGGVQQELAELNRLSKHVAVLIDSERTAPNAALSAERDAFVRDSQGLGFAVRVTDLRAFENYLTQSAIQAVLGPSFRALGPYELLRDMAPSWAKHDNWRIARHMSATEVLATDIGQFLNSL